MPGLDFVAAVDFGGSKVTVASATLAGEIIDRLRRLDTDAPRGAEQAIEATRSYPAPSARPAAAAWPPVVVSPGIVNAGRIVLAPNLPGWEDLALKWRLR